MLGTPFKTIESTNEALQFIMEVRFQLVLPCAKPFTSLQYGTQNPYTPIVPIVRELRVQIVYAALV